MVPDFRNSLPVSDEPSCQNYLAIRPISRRRFIMGFSIAATKSATFTSAEAGESSGRIADVVVHQLELSDQSEVGAFVLVVHFCRNVEKIFVIVTPEYVPPPHYEQIRRGLDGHGKTAFWGATVSPSSIEALLSGPQELERDKRYSVYAAQQGCQLIGSRLSTTIFQAT